jgi:hypothetical protein
VQFADQVFPHQQDQIVRTKGAMIASYLRHDHGAQPTAADAFIGSDISTDSHGVCDPSGHARGRFQRAHRGRSRHGFLR